jgi:hypothetical protein
MNIILWLIISKKKLYQQHELTILQGYEKIEEYRRRFQKLKLMIEHQTSFVSNLHKPSGVKYAVARTYWINDKTGKKFRKFSKNLGSEERVLVNGEIPEYMKEKSINELDHMMWKQYTLEYPKLIENYSQLNKK